MLLVSSRLFLFSSLQGPILQMLALLGTLALWHNTCQAGSGLPAARGFCIGTESQFLPGLQQ